MLQNKGNVGSNSSTNLSKSGSPTKKASQNLPAQLANVKRRSSSRSIKRKRFDDEIVEYSIGFQQARNEQNHSRRQRASSVSQFHLPAAPPPPPPPTPLRQQRATTPAIVIKAEVTSSPLPPPDAPLTAPIGNISSTINKIPPLVPVRTMNPPQKTHTTMDRRRTPRPPNRRTKRIGRPPNQLASKDLGRWKPIDDLALIIGVQRTNDLRILHRGVKFSCKFTLQEIQARWYSLLYEPAISRTASAAMRNLHPEMIQAVQQNTLFNIQEEELLSTIKSTDNPKLEQFQELLEKNSSVFYHARTAKSLQNHWQLMKQYLLLPDQVVKPLHMSDQPLNFSDAEDGILDAELHDQRDETLEIELALTDRKQKREIRLLENELSRWNVLVDSITGVGLSPEFDGQTLAVLRGRLVRYLMRSKEITFGRDAKDCTVDVDMSLEGAAGKISRRQGTIKLRSNGDFFIANEGKRPLFIDGSPLMTGCKTRLTNNCVLEISNLRFIFLVNYELINAIRHESAKTTAPLK